MTKAVYRRKGLFGVPCLEGEVEAAVAAGKEMIGVLNPQSLLGDLKLPHCLL